MRRHRIDIRLIEKRFVGFGVICFHTVDQFGLPHQLAGYPSAWVWADEKPFLARQ